jgi:hypothetical protein
MQASPDSKTRSNHGRLASASSKIHESSCWPVQATPIVSSKVQRIAGPDLSKTTGRGFKGIYKKITNDQEYHPNHKAVWKGTGKKILTFEATLPRAEFFKTPEFVVETKDVKYSQIDSNMQVPNLQKTTARANDEEVPTFMVNLHYLDRVCGHIVPNYKSLKMNNYMTTNFLPLMSSFQSPSKSRMNFQSSKLSSPLGKYN